jgi:tRNA modification GTPase
MRGGSSEKIKELRERLIHLASMIELERDLSQEDVEFADKEELKELVQELLELMQKLADSFSLGNVLKHGVSTVIAGRPNAGKSTLLNRLLNEERAIVSDIPGTTRDVIEEAISLEGITFRFIDTAGIREASDKIESIGVERTYEQVEQAALVVYVFDVNEVTPQMLKEDVEQLDVDGTPLILIGNKIDQRSEKEVKKEFKDFDEALYLSAEEGTNVDRLKEQLVEQVQARDRQQESVVVTNARHYEALTKARDSLKDVLQGIDNEVTGDLLALDIQHALHFLGEITGEVTTDDILEDIFSNFCIGK